MNILNKLLRFALCATFASLAPHVAAADFPAPKEASAVIKNFRFNTGEVMPELRKMHVPVREAA